MVGQIIAFGDWGVLFDNSDELMEKRELQLSEIVTGLRNGLWLFKRKGKTCLEAHILSIEQLKE